MQTTTTPDLETRVRELLAEVSPLRLDKIKLDHSLRGDLALDSVASMELVSMLCEEFDIDVEIEEAMEVADVRGAIDMVRTHLGKR